VAQVRHDGDAGSRTKVALLLELRCIAAVRKNEL
jgi:hypothetical protein